MGKIPEGFHTITPQIAVSNGDKAIALYQQRSSQVSVIREIVIVQVQSAQPIDSPAYDLGLTEDEVRARWERYWQSVRAGKTTSPTGE